MTRPIASDRHVGRTELEDFIRPRHHGILMATRRDGRPQASLVTMGLSTNGEIVVSTYPERAKVKNLRRNPSVSVCVLSDDFGGEWVQVYGKADVTDVPMAVEGLVEYYRVISGEHPDWDEYRQAMIEQGKSLITITISDWGPISRGGFPARLA